MNELDYVQAFVLGILQGITEFLPISSSGHLALAQGWLGLDPASPPMLLLDVLAHVGTVLAVAIVFRRPFTRFIARLNGEFRGRYPRGRRHACRILALSIAASVVTAVIGLGFKDSFESAFDKPAWIGAGLIGTGLLLLGLTFVARGRKGWGEIRWWHAMLIGLAQGVAIFPGISRSGATICAALYCGVRRRWAGQFSFLIAVPAVCGAAMIKATDILGESSSHATELPWGPLLVSTVVSFGVGIVALRLLLHVVERAKMHYFSLYCAGLGLIALLRSA